MLAPGFGASKLCRASRAWEPPRERLQRLLQFPSANSNTPITVATLIELSSNVVPRRSDAARRAKAAHETNQIGETAILGTDSKGISNHGLAVSGLIVRAQAIPETTN